MSDALKRPQAASVQLYLKITHPSIDPGEISRAFSIEPEHTVRAGAALSARGVRKVHSESYWLASLPTQSLAELASWTRPAAHVPQQTMPTTLRSLRLAHATGIHGMQILLWLRKLESQRDFIERINREGGSITLVLQRPEGDAPFNFSPLLALRLSELEIALELD